MRLILYYKTSDDEWIKRMNINKEDHPENPN